MSSFYPFHIEGKHPKLQEAYLRLHKVRIRGVEINKVPQIHSRRRHHRLKWGY